MKQNLKTCCILTMKRKMEESQSERIAGMGRGDRGRKKMRSRRGSRGVLGEGVIKRAARRVEEDRGGDRGG